MLDPGTNAVSFVKFQILYDPSKLSISGANALAVNSTAFSQTLEGPVVDNGGTIAAAVGIGSDPTKAITTPTKVATLTFTAVQNSGSPVEIKFGTISQVLSIAAGDKANDNVLSTTESAFVVIGQLTSTIVPSPTGTNPGATGTNPSPTSGSLTSTPIPTATDIPYPSVTPGGPTPTMEPSGFRLILQLLLHGIGSAGDNANKNESSLSNKSPVHQEVPLNVQIVNSDNKVVATKLVTAFYDADNGIYFSHVDVPTTLPKDDYVVKVKADNYLRKLMPGFFTIEPGKATVLPKTDLAAGDINGDNQINVLDYNVLYDCGYGALKPLPIVDSRSLFHSQVCESHQERNGSDVNDDGRISASDYNLFIRELSVQTGE